MSDVSNFYQSLPALTHFSDIAHGAHFQRVPEDWVIAMTDVVRSTDAIAAGRHKEVNIAGVLGIVAQGNFYKHLDFPFAFGGDGATFLLPAAVVPQIKDILADSRMTCQHQFQLTLRVAFVPVKAIYAAGHELGVAKLQVSASYMQAVMIGSGFDYAEHLMKTDGLNDAYLLPSDYQPAHASSYTGLFCPFQHIQSRKEETVSLIIKLASRETPQQQKTLDAVLQALQGVLGHERSYHPLVDTRAVRMATPQQTQQLAALQSRRTGGMKFRAVWTLHKIFRLVTIGMGKVGPKDPLARDADVRKCDGSVKMVLVCSTAQRRALQSALDGLHEHGEVFYGMHISDKVLVTCLVQFSTGKGVHFVDGADGGYAFAARALKAQLATVASDAQPPQ
jgi:hypothetical protein